MLDTSNVDVFIDLYTRLETDAKLIYGVSDGFIDWLAKKGGKARGPHSKFLNKKRNALYCCKEVRNVIQHNQRLDEECIVVPGDHIVEELREIVEKIESVRNAGELCVPARDIYKRKLSDPIAPTLQEMLDKSYSYVPIVDDRGRVSGVFSEGTILSCMARLGYVGFEDNDLLSSVEDYLPVESHETEYFRFTSPATPAPMVAEMFLDALDSPKRLGAVFVTGTGDENGIMQGMITAWDMAQYF